MVSERCRVSTDTQSPGISISIRTEKGGLVHPYYILDPILDTGLKAVFRQNKQSEGVGVGLRN